ncbi:DUF1152 domain-containing protein [Candidatus Jorgensenbacteria bacterium]|nr:DUF1152 domain-containing protein [Candidatus Jorgensenbacteria bacterium]
MNLNRVFFLGTGGGNDVFSCTLAAISLWKLGWRWKECAFAGVLSPFHRHDVIATDIAGAFITQPDSGRFINRKDKELKIGFVDAAVAALVRDSSAYNARSVYGLSLSRGTTGLSETLKQLSNSFDYFVLVDIGGDCFYGGERDRHVLSPMFDAMAIKAFIDSGVPGLLYEAGPGTDGELEPEAIEQSLLIAEAESLPMLRESMIEWEGLYNKWISPVRQGRTVPVTIQAFNSPDEILTLTYRARAHLGATRLYSNFTHRIKTALCKNFYLIDPRKIQNPFMVACSDPLDWFQKTQVVQCRTNCEPNLEYLHMNGSVYQFLTPSPLFSRDDRLGLITQGLREMREGSCDAVWMFEDDEKVICESLGSFSLEKKSGLIEVSNF